MSRRVVFNDPGVGEFVAAQALCRWEPGTDASIGTVDADGVALGGFVFTGDTGRSISVHMAGRDPLWCTRDLLWAAFDFPFNQLGLTKVFAVVSASNVDALALDLRAGFKIEAVLHDMFPGGPAFVLGMYRQDCRWLDVKPRSIARRSPAGAFA